MSLALFNAQQVSDVNTSILRILQLICYFMGCIARQETKSPLSPTNTDVANVFYICVCWW